jgi:exo-rhamnogalacturonan lyase-like protein
MTLSRQLCTVASLLLLSCGALPAQTAKSVAVAIKETAGIRRFGFPVNTRVPFPKGALANPTNARLLLDGKEVPVECTAESRWPDGSVQWLAVDVAVTAGPKETQNFRLEYGPDVKAMASPRPLPVTEEASFIQVGSWRFSKTANPLVMSVKYRNEEIATGINGIAVTDASGAAHEIDVSKDGPPKVEIVKRGPLYVLLRYTGKIALDTQYSVPYTIEIGMPNSKAWAKIATTVEDPGKRVRELSFHTPVNIGPFPWVWDFGTPRWTYGQLQNAQEQVIMTQTVRAGGTADWTVSVGPKGKEESYETMDRSAPVSWAHLQTGPEAVAMFVDESARQPGTYKFSLSGDGQTSFRYTPAQPGTRHQLTVYEHYVRTPVHIGAATSPAAGLAPLVAEWDKAQYAASGLKAPRN